MGVWVFKAGVSSFILASKIIALPYCTVWAGQRTWA